MELDLISESSISHYQNAATITVNEHIRILIKYTIDDRKGS